MNINGRAGASNEKKLKCEDEMIAMEWNSNGTN